MLPRQWAFRRVASPLRTTARVAVREPEGIDRDDQRQRIRHRFAEHHLAHAREGRRIAPVGPRAHPGDGFLFERGFTVASIGWQWDVNPSPELMGLDAPSAVADGRPVVGETMVEIRPNERGTTRLLADAWPLAARRVLPQAHQSSTAGSPPAKSQTHACSCATGRTARTRGRR